VIKEIAVGALPDMITFSPDGNFIMTANEGEPNDTYSIETVLFLLLRLMLIMR
jgi:hypothetical protein